jgi:hypothetical protein
MEKEKQYEEGLKWLDAGLQIAEPIRYNSLIRHMKYHKVGCLKGLKRDKEADTLARQLWEECVKEGDTRNIEDLKKEGYDFRR